MLGVLAVALYAAGLVAVVSGAVGILLGERVR